MKSIFRAFFHKTESLEKSCPIHGTNDKELSFQTAAAKDFAKLFCSV